MGMCDAMIVTLFGECMRAAEKKGLTLRNDGREFVARDTFGQVQVRARDVTDCRDQIREYKMSEAAKIDARMKTDKRTGGSSKKAQLVRRAARDRSEELIDEDQP